MSTEEYVCIFVVLMKYRYEENKMPFWLARKLRLLVRTDSSRETAKNTEPNCHFIVALGKYFSIRNYTQKKASMEIQM